MIEKLKKLSEKNKVRFTDKNVIDFTEKAKMRVHGVRAYSADDNEIVIVELEDLYLVAHNFDTENTKCFIYQMMDSGKACELEKDGYCFLTEDLDFRSKIVNRDDSHSHAYKHSEIGPLYDLYVERNDYEEEEAMMCSLCEYVCSSSQFTHIIIEKIQAGDHFEDINLNAYQGFEIDLDAVSLST